MGGMHRPLGWGLKGTTITEQFYAEQKVDTGNKRKSLNGHQILYTQVIAACWFCEAS